MSQFEYRVIAAPKRGVKAKGLKSGEARFSHALEELMNAMASEGWEYQRAETLPSVERSGLTSTTTMWRNVLVFRRLKQATTETTQPPLRREEPTDAGQTAATSDVSATTGAEDTPTEPSRKDRPPETPVKQAPAGKL